MSLSPQPAQVAVQRFLFVSPVGQRRQHLNHGTVGVGEFRNRSNTCSKSPVGVVVTNQQAGEVFPTQHDQVAVVPRTNLVQHRRRGLPGNR